MQACETWLVMVSGVAVLRSASRFELVQSVIFSVRWIVV